MLGRLRRRPHSLSLEESVAYADSASDLAMLEAVGFPVAVNPESRLSAIARRRGWHVEHWAKAEGGSHRPLPLGPFDVRSPQGGAWAVRDEHAPLRALAPPLRRGPGGLVVRLGTRRRRRAPAAGRAGRARRARPPGWVHVDPVLSGICGSDLATLDGRSSRYFEDIVSFPFVPGHEVVGTLADDAVAADGARAGGRQPGRAPARARVRGPGHRAAVPRLPGRAGRELRASSPSGTSGPGLQTGFCADTGGGWSTPGSWPTRASSTRVPDGLSDADAVTVEPVACAVHAVLGAPIADGDVVAVLGAGTLGLLVTAALGHLAASGRCPSPSALLVGARYPHQQRLARELGATEALPPDQLPRAVRRHSRSLSYGGASGMTAPSPAAPTSSSTAWAAPSRSPQSLAMVRPARDRWRWSACPAR